VTSARQVAVIGGGVSGLTAAYRLTRPGVPVSGVPVEVTVLEAEDRLGGKVAAADVGGIVVDTGPDALMARAPAAVRLLSELGLDGSLRAPSAAGAYLWSRGRLRPLPAGSVFGVPDKLWPLLRSGLLGPLGFVRAGADLVLPRREPPGDPTIEEILRPRFGRQVFERLVEPLLGGVHAGRAGRLSARSAAAEVMALASGHRSLYFALRRRKASASSGSGASAAPPRPALMTLEGGLGRLVDALAEAVAAAGGVVRTGATVRELRHQGDRYLLSGTGFDPLEVDDVVLATPAWRAAELLRPVAPTAADALAAIPYVGVAMVVLAYPPDAVPEGLHGTGFLVPPAEGRLLVGCTWLTAKWPHLTARWPHLTVKWPHLVDGAPPSPPPVLIRAMVGRDGDQVWSGLDDDSLVTAVRAELVAAMGLHAEPLAVHVRRSPAGMPQYTVGHAERLAIVGSAVAATPGLHLTGAGYRGVGLAGCIAQAGDAAAAVLARTPEAVTIR
jgi:oxygen-dependent protoporphyrinogen oxidase